MKVRINKEFVECNLPTATKEDLIDLKTKIDTEIDYVKMQLDEAGANFHATGEYADPKWYAKAKGAGKFLGRASQLVQNELRKRKELAKNDLHIKFVNIAKIRLDSELFNEIMEEAKDEQFNQ